MANTNLSQLVHLSERPHSTAKRLAQWLPPKFDLDFLQEKSLWHFFKLQNFVHRVAAYNIVTSFFAFQEGWVGKDAMPILSNSPAPLLSNVQDRTSFTSHRFSKFLYNLAGSQDAITFSFYFALNDLRLIFHGQCRERRVPDGNRVSLQFPFSQDQ